MRQIAIVGLIAGFTCTAAGAQATGTAPQALTLSGAFAGTHDPSIAFEHGTYYVFATGAVHPGGSAVARSFPRSRSGSSN
jgi:arabinan endo-1,5-alpha-L-arabinosidase